MTGATRYPRGAISLSHLTTEEELNGFLAAFDRCLKDLQKEKRPLERQMEPCQLIERSIIKKYRKELWTPFYCGGQAL